MRKSQYRRGQNIVTLNGHTGKLLKRNRPYLQWLVKLTDGSRNMYGTHTWLWESDFETDAARNKRLGAKSSELQSS